VAELLTNENLTSALNQAHANSTPAGQTLVQLNLISHEVLRAGLQAQLLCARCVGTILGQ